jgi:hypothetical protein
LRTKRVIFAVALLLALLLVSCKGNEVTGPQPFGTLTVDGVAINGSSDVGSVRIYTLSNITAGNKYMVRTTILAGGVLRVAIYSSFFAYKAGVAPIAVADDVIPNYFYEASFVAPESGDYVAVLSGVPSPASPSLTSIYFYELRIMSGTANLSTFQSPTVIPLVTAATGTGLIRSGNLKVYSGADITPSGTYDVVLTSSTVTLSHPQMFIYRDDSLSLASLMYSVISSTDWFTVSTFPSTPTTTPTSSYLSSTATVSAVTFTSGPGGGPFILLKGVSQATYTLSVGP